MTPRSKAIAWFRGLTTGQRMVVLAVIVAAAALIANRDWSAEAIFSALVMAFVQVGIIAIIMGVLYRVFRR